MNTQPISADLIGELRTAAIVMENLPQLPGYNGSILTIDDNEALKIAMVISQAVAELERAQQGQAHQGQACLGRNCHSVDGGPHSDECYEDHKRSYTGAENVGGVE